MLPRTPFLFICNVIRRWGIFVFCLISINGLAQKRITFTVSQVSTTIGDCDGFPGGDSDPTWWWTGPNEVDDQCYQVTCNGCTQNVSISLMDESYDCALDVPSSISVTFEGCEDDGPTGCVLGSALSIICDGNYGSRTDVLNTSITNGSYLFPQYCVNATGCSGQYCYRVRMDVSGSFPISSPNNMICSYTNMGALNVGGNLFVNNSNNLCANTEAGEPNVSGGDESVWFRFTTGAAVASEVTISFDGSGNGDDVTGYIALYSVSPAGSCAFGNLSFIDDASQFVPFVYDVSLDVTCLSPNTTYFVQVDGIDGLNDAGIFDLTISDNNIVANSANNICSYTNLGTVALGNTLSVNNQNNYCANYQSGEPNASNGDNTVWYRFTTGATVPGEIYVNFDGSGNGDEVTGYVAVYEVNPSNTCAFGNLSFVDDATQLIPFVYDVSLTVTCLKPNTNYFVQLDGVDGLNNEGIFNLSITNNSILANTANNICNYVDLGTFDFNNNLAINNQNNYCADVQGGEPNASNGDETEWYRFTTGASVASEINIFFDGSGNGDEITGSLTLYSVSPSNSCAFGNLTYIDDDFQFVPFYYDVTLTAECLFPNTTYFIQVDGVDGLNDEGIFNLSISDNGVPKPTNNDICNAENVGVLSLGTTINLPLESNFCSDVQPGEPLPSGVLGHTDNTVWYRFTTDNSISNIGYEVYLDASGIPTFFGTVLNVYSDPDANCNTISDLNLLQNFDEIGGIADPDISDRTVRCLQPNTTYYVQVDGRFGSLPDGEDEFTLSIVDNSIVRALNDNICNATPLGRVPNNGSVILPDENNYCAGIHPGEYGGANWGNGVGLFNSPEQTIWYTFRAPSSQSVVIYLDNDAPPTSDNINIEASVYQSSNNTCTGFLGELESGDPLTSMSLLGNNSLRITCLDTTKTYFIQIDGDNIPLLEELRVGHFRLHIEDYQSPPAPNDEICDAIYIGNPTGGTVGLQYESNFCADNILEPIPSGFQTDMTVWYTFTAPASGRVHVFANETDNPNGDPEELNLQLAIFGTDNQADPCNGNLFEVRSEYNVGEIEYPFDLDYLTNDEYLRDVYCLIPGNTYFIMVDGESELIGTVDELDGYFNLDVEDIGGPPASQNDSICAYFNLGAASNTVGGTISASPFNNECATIEAGEPDPAYTDNDAIPFNGITPDNTLWFSFIAPPTGHVEITANNNVLSSTYSDNVDLQIAVYGSSNNTCSGQLTELISNYDPGFFSETVEVQCLVPGQRYFVQVDGNADFLLIDALGTGWFDLVIETLQQMPIANNDDLCSSSNFGAIASGGSASLTTQTNRCATEETGEQNVSGNNNPYSIGYDETVWYSFTTSATPGDFTINITSPIQLPPNSFINSSIVLYESFAGVTCNYNNLFEVEYAFNPVLPIPNIGSESLTVSCLRPNTTYYIQIDGLDLYFNEEGEFNISVSDDGSPNIIPANDDVCNAVAMGIVPSGSSVSLNNQNNFCALEEPGEPLVSGGNNIDDINYDETVWYTFTTNNNPGLITVTVQNVSGIDATIAVYSGAPTNCAGNITGFAGMIEVDNTFNPAPNSNINLPIPCLQPNSTYYVQIDGLDVFGDEGIFNISIADNGVINSFPPNDDICDHSNLGVVPQGGATAVVAANNFCSSEETGEPFASGNPVITDISYDETVWFIFTTPANPGTTTVNVTNANGISPVINVFSVDVYPSCNFFDLTFVGGSDFNANSVTLNCLEPNTTYYVQIDGDDVLGNVGTFNISVSDNNIPHTIPVNDDFCNALNFSVIPVNTTQNLFNQNNICASEEFAEPNVSGLTDITNANYDETVWYRYTTPNIIGNITINVTNTNNLDALISVYAVTPQGSCSFNSLSLVRTSSVLNTGDVSLYFTCVPANTEFIIQLDGIDAFGNDEGTFNISVAQNNTATVPLHDNVCNAGSVPLGSTQPGANYCATVQTGEPNAASDDETVWYSFLGPPSGEVNISINSNGDIDANFNLYLSLNASCNFSSFVQVGGNYDNFIPSFPNDPFAFDVDETISCIAPGQTYYVQVDGADLTGDYGTFSITISNPNPGYVPPPNDGCSGAINISAYIGNISCQSSDGPDWIDNDNGTATNYGNPTISILNAFTIACGENCGDTWFRFTTPIPNSGNMLIEGNDEYGLLNVTNGNLTINAYSGSCGSLNPIDCSQGGIGSDPFYYIPVNPAGGQTIYLQVYNDDINSILNPFGINGDEFGLCITDRCGSDDCLTATVMVLDTVYCWDTQGATGEDLSAGVPGYIECGNGGEPDNSIYFQFMTDSCGGTYNITLWGTIGGSCLLGIPTDGLSIAVYEDATPCDNNPQALLDCQQTDICDGENYLFTHDYGLQPNTPYILQLDGFDPFFGGGDNRGFIQLTKIPPPVTDFSATQVCLGLPTTFTDLSSGSGHDILEWIWDFGDGTSATYTAPNNPQHEYQSVDTFDVTLLTKNDPYSICYDSITKPVIVTNISLLNVSPAAAVCAGNSVTLTASGGLSYAWHPGGMSGPSVTVAPTATTNYTVADTLSGGCTPSAEVMVMVDSIPVGIIDTVLCSNESITIGSSSYNTAGTFIDTLIGAAANGCDSIVQITITLTPTGFGFRDVTICDNESFYVGGGLQTETDVYIDTVQRLNACDSIIFTTLYVLPVPVTNFDTTICEGDSVFISGSYRDSSATYYDTLVATNGCDSILATALIVILNSTTTIDTTICEGNSITVGTSVYTQSGSYSDTLPAASGCDSILTTTLTVLPAFVAIDTTICDGESLTIGTSVYTQNGTYSDTLTATLGCDSIVQTTLTILPTSSNTIAISICAGDSIFAGGNYQNTQGTYRDTFIAANGCDSILTTLLSIKQHAASNVNASICDGATYFAGGTLQTTSGNFYDTLVAANGCDSVRTTNLTVIACDDGDVCTNNFCNNAICSYTPINCTDFNDCTSDACVAGVCVYTPFNCDDADPCTIDQCINTICRHTNATLSTDSLVIQWWKDNCCCR